MSNADELLRIAEEMGRVRERLVALSRACSELRQRLGPPTDDNPEKSEQEAPRKLQSVS